MQKETIIQKAIEDKNARKNASYSFMYLQHGQVDNSLNNIRNK